MREEPCTDPYARFCGQTGAAAPSDPINDGTDSDDEITVLEQWLPINDRESRAARQVKDAQKALDARVADQYHKLTEAEIKALVVEDKWFAAIERDVQGEIERVTQTLAGRVKALEERYAEPLPVLAAEVESFSERVEGHLKKMGLSWEVGA